MERRNKILSIFCAVATLVNTFAGFLIPTTTYAKSTVTDDFIGSKILLVDKNTCGKYLTYNGEEIQAKFVVYSAEDGKEYAAYCNEPSFQGVGSNGIHYGEYIVKSKVTDDRLWRVAVNGYPYKTPTEMGANGEREAFFATKQAIYRTLDDEPISNYGSLNSEGENMIEVIQELYDIGLNGTEKYIEPKLTVKADTSETILDELDARYKSQVFNVEGNCEFEEYEVLFDVSNLPQGTKITNEDGIEKTKFDSDEKFKVMIPVEENETTSFEIQVKAKLKSMPVYQAECDNIRMQTMLITANPYETVVTDVAVKLNKITTSIKIVKKDSVTNEKLGNATFEVTKVDGEIIGTFVTDNNGEVEIKVNESGYYKIKELEAPDGYLLADNADDNEQIILVEFDKENIVTFLNDKKAGLEIIKIDKDTGKALANARYRVTKTDGTIVGEYTTNNAGKINIQDLMPDWYEVQEISAPTNYLRDEEIHKILIEENEVTTLTLTNKELKGIQIIKKDSVTDKPLANATFSIKEVGGSLIGEYTTNEMGIIEVQHLKPAFYEIKEVSAPRGYLIDTESKIVEVTSKESVVVEFFNTAKGGLQIKKVDEKTGEPLANAKFRVTTITGQTLGEFTTSRTGFINIPELEDGWYIVEETVAPDGYILDNTPKTVEVRGDKPTIVEFSNKQKGGIQILKVDEATGVPLEGAKFRVTTKNGLLVGEYTTDRQGHINLPDLDNGWYTILEIEAPKGYILDDVKKDVEVTGYKNQIVEFTNRAKAGLQILKVDSVTKQGLKDVKFKVSKINGEVIGTYKTDASGMIYLYSLDEGWYIVQEVSTINGYRIDTTPRNVEVKSNVATVVEFENIPYGSLKITKTDKDTKEVLKGVEYVLVSEDGAKKWELVTDKNGEINISKELEEGVYYLTETKSLNGYVKDNKEYKVEIKWGKTTTLNLTNEKIKGKIQVIKTSADNNQLTGTLANTRLSNAVFEIRNEKGKLIETITTNYNGVATSKSLEYGTYIVKEIKAPVNYILDTNEYTVVIKDGQTRVLNVTNKSVKVDVTIEKTGLVETQCLDTIRYDFNNIKNNSNVALDNFTWHDSLPIETKLQKVFTGTWSQNLTYSVKYKTNFESTYRLVADNLFTTQVYELDFSNIALQSDEYITDIVFEFGTVEAGFTQVQAPFIYTKVNNYLKDGTEIMNYTEVFGFYNNHKVSGNSSWKTLIFNKTLPKVKLPKTGW